MCVSCSSAGVGVRGGTMWGGPSRSSDDILSVFCVLHYIESLEFRGRFVLFFLPVLPVTSCDDLFTRERERERGSRRPRKGGSGSGGLCGWPEK